MRREPPMLTRLLLRNFKKVSQAEMEFGRAVVLIGPNNSNWRASVSCSGRLEPIIPAAVGGAVAVEVQFGSAVKALDIVGPVEIK